MTVLEYVYTWILFEIHYFSGNNEISIRVSLKLCIQV